MSTTDDVIARLDVLIRLAEMNCRLGALVAYGDRSQRDRIDLLDQVGFGPTEIAELLRTTSNTVNVALAGIRKKRKARKGTKRAAAAAVEQGT